MDAKWRVGLVGVGRGSGYGRLLTDEPRCELAAVCDSSPDALERFQRELDLPDSRCFLGYEEFVASGLDIVFVGTPIPYHAEQAVMAMQAGCHVLSEVTMASTVADCARIADVVRSTGRTYMLAENCIYWHFVSEWKAMVQAGKLGQIAHAECEYLHPIPSLIYDPQTGEKKWRINRPPLHYCSHSLGPILDITGDRIVRACGIGKASTMLDLPEPGGIDLQVALFETQKGMSIKLLRTSLLPRGKGIHYYGLHGTRGFVETGRDGAGSTGRLYIQDETEGNEPIETPLSDPNLPESTHAGGHGTAEYLLLQDFLGAIERGDKPRIDEYRGMDMTIPGLVAHDSAMSDGVWLDVPLFD